MEAFVPIDSVCSNENFVLFFVRKSGFFTLRNLANRGELGKLGVRVQSWRVFLGIFPENASFQEWLQILTESRERYSAMKNTFRMNDPLLGNSEILKLRSEISKDMDRTFQSHRFFQDPTHKNSIITLLSHWAIANPLGYAQGMTELASLIYLQLYAEKSSDPKLPVYPFNNLNYIEHDTFHIFDRLFEIGLKNLYISEKGPSQKKNFITDLFQEIKQKYTKEDLAGNPIIKICYDINDVYLKELDPELYVFLQENGIEPHLFMLRWLRCLFVRELSLNNTLVIWDHIFAWYGLNADNRNQALTGNIDFSNELVMIKFVAVSLILFVRNHLTSDISQILKRLTKLPPIEDIQLIVDLSISCKNFILLNDESFRPLLPKLAFPKTPQQALLANVRDTGSKIFNKIKYSGIIEKLKGKKTDHVDLNVISTTQWRDDNYSSVDSLVRIVDQVSCNVKVQLQKPALDKKKIFESIALLQELRAQVMNDI